MTGPSDLDPAISGRCAGGQFAIVGTMVHGLAQRPWRGDEGLARLMAESWGLKGPLGTGSQATGRVSEQNAWEAGGLLWPVLASG